MRNNYIDAPLPNHVVSFGNFLTKESVVHRENDN